MLHTYIHTDRHAWSSRPAAQRTHRMNVAIYIGVYKQLTTCTLVSTWPCTLARPLKWCIQPRSGQTTGQSRNNLFLCIYIYISLYLYVYIYISIFENRLTHPHPYTQAPSQKGNKIVEKRRHAQEGRGLLQCYQRAAKPTRAED